MNSGFGVDLGRDRHPQRVTRWSQLPIGPLGTANPRLLQRAPSYLLLPMMTGPVAARVDPPRPGPAESRRLSPNFLQGRRLLNSHYRYGSLIPIIL